MLNRRQTLTAFAALAAPALLTGAHAADTAKSAPDPLTKAILAHPIRSLDAGLSPDADPAPAIHAMFPQLIEQNFARLTNKGMSRLLGALSANELRDLGVAYTAAAGSQGRLLDLFALRLTGQELGQLTPYFGYGPVYEAVWRSAPEKSNEFAQHAIADVSSAGPETLDYGVNVGMTITEIYLTYRTAPIGALGVRAALYETAMYAGARLGTAYYGGYWVGENLVSPLIQTYAPSLHDAIGSSIAKIVNSISMSTHSTAALGQAQASAALSFDLGYLGGRISSTGGDYGVCSAWQSWSGGSGKCMTCYFEIE